jgi:hypothetical protein
MTGRGTLARTMPKRFFVQLELRDARAREEGNGIMDSEMRSKGFRNWVLLNGKSHELPRGSYIGVADKAFGSREDVARFIESALRRSSREGGSFVVVETEEPLFTNNLATSEPPASVEEDPRPPLPAIDVAEEARRSPRARRTPREQSH